MLQQYPWPGNVWELENVLERAVMFSTGDRIDSESLSGLIAGAENSPVSGAASSLGKMAMAASRGIVAATPLPGVFRVEPKLSPTAPAEQAVATSTDPWPTLADVERVHLERTLAATMQNKSLAAKMLGVDRSVLRRKLQRYGLDDEES